MGGVPGRATSRPSTRSTTGSPGPAAGTVPDGACAEGPESMSQGTEPRVTGGVSAGASPDTAAMDPQPGPAAFDAAPAADLAPRLAVCLHAGAWVDAVLGGRPYRTLPALEQAALAAAADLDDAALAEALAAHPRIGDRPQDASAASAHSRREQAAIDADEATATRLHAANVAYETRFGQVLLVRAAGRTAEEVLRLAQDRLGNDPVTEGRVVREQLGEIAVLRLHDLLADLLSGPGPAGPTDARTDAPGPGAGAGSRR